MSDVSKPQHVEIEVRFTDIDPAALQEKLRALGATDKGEDFYKEIIFYDQNREWQKEQNKHVRLRSTADGVKLTYKYNFAAQADGTEEIEITVSDFNKTTLLLKKMGLTAYRQQEKKRHTFLLDKVVVDIDQWPKIPPYVELEGERESDLQAVAEKLGLDWNAANMESASWVIEHIYKIPVRNLRYFTFDKVE